MYFACAPLNRDMFTPELMASFQKLSLDRNASLQLHAIVDAGFESQLARWARTHGVSVGEESSLASIKEHLPFVTSLGEQPSANEITRVIESAKGCPMLSFIASWTDARGLAKELRKLLIAHTDDGMHWPLRFADTRVLPALLDELSCRESRQVLTPDVSAWWWPQRDGQLATFVNSAALPPDNAENRKLDLTEKQFARMMHAAQPDGVIAQLYQACPDILDRYAPDENHRRVRAALDLLAPKGFDSAELHLRWAALALSLSPRLESIPALVVALEETQVASELLVRIDQLPDEVWAAQESAP